MPHHLVEQTGCITTLVKKTTENPLRKRKIHTSWPH